MKVALSWLARWIGLICWAAASLLVGAWCSLAVWFRFDAGETVRDLLVGTIAIFTLLTAASLATSRRWPVFACYVIMVAVVLAW